MHITDNTVLDCGHTPTVPRSSFSTGYGTGHDGRTRCFACCADSDKAAMVETGRATLYLARKYPGKYHVANWTGSLSFDVLGGTPSKGRHNIARVQYSARFVGPDGATWSARSYGDNNEIAHCRRLASI